MGWKVVLSFKKLAFKKSQDMVPSLFQFVTFSGYVDRVLNACLGFLGGKAHRYSINFWVDPFLFSIKKQQM